MKLQINIEREIEVASPAVAFHSVHSSSELLEEQMEDDVIMDIKAIIEDSEEGLLSDACCIYKVPHLIRELKPNAYTPRTVSIGPYHYGNEGLQNMERHKHIYFKRFIEGAKIRLDDLLNFVKLSEPRVRASYSENITLSHRELVKVIFVDAGFIIELFRGFCEEVWLGNDAKLSKPWFVDTIINDLILLENQLPFFLLEELYNRAFPIYLCGDVPPFLKLTYEFFDYFNMQKLEPNPNIRIKHFTDLLRLFYLQGQTPQTHPFNNGRKHVLLYSATELHEAGVKFKASSSKCLLDLKFSKGVLEIPQILVEDSTEALFRNVIALEQCHYPFASYITDYAVVLDGLINTNKDVDVLIHREIIYSYLSDTNDVAKLFNGLWKNVIQSNFNSEYIDIGKRLNAFYQDPWHKKKATLRRDYCDTPWRSAASVAGIVLLVLSLVQAVFSVLQVVVKKI